MRKVLFLLCATLVVVGSAAVAMTLDEALELYQNDSIMVSYDAAGKAKLEEIIATFRTALGVTDALNEENEDAVDAFAVDPSLKPVVNKLTQAYYAYANVFLSTDENESTYLKGKHWGLKSLRMNPTFKQLQDKDFVDAVKVETDVEALYWTTSNWLRVSQKHALQAVFAGVPAKTQAMSERCIQLAPNYVAGGPFRSLGAYYSGLPIGQDLDKALYYLCHVITDPACSACGDCQPAITNANEYFENRTFLAEFYYMEKKMWAEAAGILQTVIAEPIGAKYPMMNAYSQENAKKLLAECQKHM
ncbi:MAG: TRAP transporter TatT component family protein [Candidatus Bipolaricaulota bacterium]|nr:TRAP transporter TatT component family protein [Candidatus Bipolaricaulota bacterium]